MYAASLENSNSHLSKIYFVGNKILRNFNIPSNFKPKEVEAANYGNNIRRTNHQSSDAEMAIDNCIILVEVKPAI